MSDSDEDQSRWDYVVLRNDEDQYSLWPSVNEAPPGWHEVGFRGSKQECMAYVDQHWTDMRPLSLRGPAPG